MMIVELAKIRILSFEKHGDGWQGDLILRYICLMLIRAGVVYVSYVTFITMKIEGNKKFKKVTEEVACVADYMWHKGWAERNAGNISVNVSTVFGDLTGKRDLHPEYTMPGAFPELAGMSFFITGTGRRMRDIARKPLRNAVLINVNNDGTMYRMISTDSHATGDVQPTSELSTHLGIHQMIARRQSQEKAVIHTHATEIIALSQLPFFKTPEAINRILWSMHPETMVFIPGGVGFVPYTLPGTDEIASRTISELQQHDVVIWEKHGVFAIGHTVYDSFDLMDIVCKCARIWFLCKSAGFDPEGLTSEQLLELNGLAGKFNRGTGG